MPATTFRTLLAQNDLPPSFMYLAPILPVVQVMWADDKNQMPEREKIQLLLEQHCKALTEICDGVEPVSKADRDRFIGLFVSTRPDPGLLSQFGEIALELVSEKQSRVPQGDRSLNNPNHLKAACMEIAAACAANYPWPDDDPTQKRIVDQEQDLIVTVVELFKREA